MYVNIYIIAMDIFETIKGSSPIYIPSYIRTINLYQSRVTAHFKGGIGGTLWRKLPDFPRCIRPNVTCN